MALGATLKTAREAKGLTVAELANELHLKMQIVEDLENEDFSNIKASIYGRGFIKLCAERLGIDPGPLLDEFKDTYQKPSHEMAPYGTPEYRRQEELARARAAANVASAPPRQPKPILPSEPVDIAPKPVPTAGPAAPAAVVVSPAVPVEVAPAEPAAAPEQQAYNSKPVAAAPEQQAYDSKATPAAAPEQPTFDSKPAPAASSASVAPASVSAAEDSLFQHPEAAPAPAAPAPALPAETENLLFPMTAPRAATVSVDPPRDARPRTGIFVPQTRQQPALVEERPEPPKREKKVKPPKPPREGPSPLSLAATAVRAGIGRFFAALGEFFSRNARTVAFGFASLLMAVLAVWAIVGIRSSIHDYRVRHAAVRPPAAAPAATASASDTAQNTPAVWSELILPPPVLYAE